MIHGTVTDYRTDAILTGATRTGTTETMNNIMIKFVNVIVLTTPVLSYILWLILKELSIRIQSNQAYGFIHFNLIKLE